MAQYTINGERLRGLIGRRVRYQGHDCTIIEVLDDEPAVVLRCHENLQVIQPDQFGDPVRRVPATHTIPVLGSDGQSLDPVFKELGTIDPRDWEEVSKPDTSPSQPPP